MFTKENAAEMQARGVAVRMLFTSPERRRYVAQRAAKMRWYDANGDDLERVECLLRLFQREVADALMENDHDRVMRAASNMLGWERLKIALRSGRMKDVTPEISAELEGKLEKARERREKALVGESAPVDTTAMKTR